MKYIIAALIVLFGVAAHADPLTPRLGGLDLIPTGTLNWGVLNNANYSKISTNAASQIDANTFTSSNTLQAPLLLTAAAFLNVLSTGAQFQDAYHAGAVSIVSTQTYGHTNWPLTIGNLPANDAVGLMFASTDTTIPWLYATINNNASATPINIQNGLYVGGITNGQTSAGITVYGSGGITNNFGQLTSTQAAFIQTDGNAILDGGGLRAGCGIGNVIPGCGVGIINKNGQIPALTSTYFANLDASNLTGSPAFLSNYLPLAGGTMSGTLQMSNGLGSASLTGNINFSDQFYHSLTFKATSSPNGWPLGEIQWIQGGTGMHRIVSFDANDTATQAFPGQLVIGADPSGAAGNNGVTINGSSTVNPDLHVSTFGWTSIGTSSPVANGSSYGLYVAGNFTSTGTSNFGIGTGTGNGIATFNANGELKISIGNSNGFADATSISTNVLSVAALGLSPFFTASQDLATNQSYFGESNGTLYLGRTNSASSFLGSTFTMDFSSGTVASQAPLGSVSLNNRTLATWQTRLSTGTTMVTLAAITMGTDLNGGISTNTAVFSLPSNIQFQTVVPGGISLSTKMILQSTGTLQIGGTSAVTDGSLKLWARGDVQVDGFTQLGSQTIAQLLAITPTAVGQTYWCSNCKGGAASAVGTIVSSTGTSAGNFVSVGSAVFQ